MGRSYEHEFPKSVKRDVKESQGFRCFYCNGFCRGPEYHEPRLEAHHIIPVAAGGPPIRENACGLCGNFHGEQGCHRRFDQLYFKEGKTVLEVMLEEGRWADLRQHPAVQSEPAKWRKAY